MSSHKIMVSRDKLNADYQNSLEDLMEKAWKTRVKYHVNTIAFAAPSPKYYEIENYKNDSNTFINVSVTGDKCALRCEHCKGNLLKSMHSAESSNELISLGESFVKKGCKGMLISGGADANGEVPLKYVASGIKELKRMGLKVIVHTGLISEETARILKECEVDQVLTDVIGDRKTAQKVYHLDKTPEYFGNALRIMVEAGLNIAPHIVIGLDYGRVLGELEALYQVTNSNAQTIVLVVLNPLPNTPMSSIEPPQLGEVGKIIALARILSPKAKIMLGCAKPPKHKEIIERLALNAGVNAIAYPADETVSLAKDRNLHSYFSPLCCSLL
ncbi:hypothetical protein MFMK1_003081 [Metallumcola ferriviriculae]|uniref:Radical SAM core domain-containing protein n=1 Tax=Metallumcola ferriviriculae TaxID=3039180 RepID=A0AAU0UQ53_9FIRM|nr:hypothetical protein MFMK1_003081 [Desulfitibacteraceae bacterium MK1]